MVAKISTGGNMFGALAYNQNKVDSGEAKVLFSNRMLLSEDGNFSIGDGESFVLNVNNGDNAEPLTIATNNKQSTQYFKFVDNEDGTYTIVTRASKDLSCVEIAGAQTSGGAVAQQWAWNDNDCQKWVLEPVAYTLPSQTTTVTTTILTTTETTTTKPATTTAKPVETIVTKPVMTTAKPVETTTTKPITTTTKLMETTVTKP